MENIFEGAKFGDKFVGRDGKIILFLDPYDIGKSFCYHESWGEVIYDNSTNVCITMSEFGPRPDTDVVSKYQEPIDEEKLEELAEESKNFIKMLCSDMHVFEMATTYEAGFINGYRKAMEEK